MSSERKNIPAAVERLLWGIAAGRCEFEGCNKQLYKHDVTETIGNYAEKAHIHAVSPGGARYDIEKTDTNNINNLMLVCSACHKTIDDYEENYPPDRLFTMKQRHEERIINLTDIDVNRKSTMLFYTANIAGKHISISENSARIALASTGRYPTADSPIDLSMSGNHIEDDAPDFYQQNANNMTLAFEKRVTKVIETGTHISVFAFAPQPLLMYLGSLISDKYAVNVFQRQRRSDDDWQWEEKYSPIEFLIDRINTTGENIAVVFSLSSSVNDNRIFEALGSNTIIYKMYIANPNRDFVKHPAVIDTFISRSREMLELIKHTHGNRSLIHIFPIMPLSLAVRFGMDYMPKTDNQMIIYDEHKDKGFTPALIFGGNDATKSIK